MLQLLVGEIERGRAKMPVFELIAGTSKEGESIPKQHTW